MGINEPTFVGRIASVTGGIVRVRLRIDMPSTIIMIKGEAYRVGQVGAFYRIPLGYSHLYAICTQVGADAAPPNLDLHTELKDDEGADQEYRGFSGYRWMTVVLFGESLGQGFERGVGQYPTVGDEVHIVTTSDLTVIYSGSETDGSLTVGTLAAASGIPAKLNLGRLITRHSAILGSTGSGKSNLVAVLVNSIATAAEFPSARILVIDPHGEYSSALRQDAKVFKLKPDAANGEEHLWVPYWALPLSDLLQIASGGFQPNIEAAIREAVLDMKRSAASLLDPPFPAELLTADAPVPFSIRKLWFELDDFERQTFSVAGNAQEEKTRCIANKKGDPDKLLPNSYPPADPYNKAPYKNIKKRNIERQLDFMRIRLSDSRLDFLFQLGGGFMPDESGKVEHDISDLLAGWVGHDKPVTILDVSGVPAEILSTVVGTMLKLIYETLFWASGLDVGGRRQPLLILIEEAHRFVPEKDAGPANVILSTIAKEGRKYGVGLMVVTQRPTEIDNTILSQCGTFIALRTTNSADRAKVSSAFPDDLGGLSDLLPALRTGEGLFLGEALPIPSRIRIKRAANKPIGDDPQVAIAWGKSPRPTAESYVHAVKNWRRQSAS
jgi:DNA helicase HerA-like ATPase